MEFKTLKQSHLKRNIIIGVLVVGIISVVVLNFTRAKYRTTESIPLVTGTINYTPGDIIFNTYYNNELLKKFPTKEDKYSVDKIVCDNEATATFDENNWEIEVNNLKVKGTKCNIYIVEKEFAKDTILANNKVNTGRPNFREPATTDEGIYQATDDYGTSYYFRGAVTNNYVKFIGYYWRIVRINGNDSIRIIFQGKDIDGTEPSISNTVYNSEKESSEYVGYTNSSGSSNLKFQMDNWFKNNLIGYEKFLDINAGFCNDRGISSSTNNLITYIGVSRIGNPSFKCSNSQYLYTSKDANNGNKSLTYPIGAITSDEINFAGGVYEEKNNKFYLYTGQDYWTMTPSSFRSPRDYAQVFTLNSRGYLAERQVYRNADIRPVINLHANVKLTGSGTSSDPYVVEGAE